MKLSSLMVCALIVTPGIAMGNDNAWQFSVGGGIEREAAYTGSDVYTTEALFDFRVDYQLSDTQHLWLSLGEIGSSWEFKDDWTLMAVLEYEEGRDNSEDPVLAEFDEVEDTVEAQVTLMKEWGDFYVAGVLQPDLLDRGKGFVSFLALGYEYEVNPKLSIESSIDISFADAEHMMTEVGITDQVSARSGFDAYSPSSGYKSSTLELGLEYEFNQNWSLISSLNYEYYGSAMADSPLIKEFGSRGNYGALAAIQFTF